MPEKTSTVTDEMKSKPAIEPGARMDDTAALRALGINSMSHMGVAWVEAMSEMGSEILSFIADRIKEDVKTQHRILNCKDVGELQKIQSDFIQTAIDQYSTETGKLVEMSRGFIKTADEDEAS